MPEITIEVNLPQKKMAKELFIIHLYTFKYVDYKIENFDTQEKMENIQKKALQYYLINPEFHKAVEMLLEVAKEVFDAK